MLIAPRQSFRIAPGTGPVVEGVARSTRSQRRGITLLFVVSMIVLFLLMGTTFVIVANSFSNAAKKRIHKHLLTVDYQPIVENAFYELLRGTDLNNAVSPLRGHSLLEDMYGYGFSATIGTAVADSSGHFLNVELNADARKLIDGTAYTPQPVPGALAGLVLTVVSGPAKGMTTRIIDHQVDGTAGGETHTLLLMPHWMDNRFSVPDAAAAVNARVVVNGRPFAGTGAGHFQRTTLTSPSLSNSARTPNQVGRSRDEFLGLAGGQGYYSYATPSGSAPNSVGPNESYDTFDFQNMFLGGLRPDGTAIPSFHRPELIASSPFPARADFRAFDRGGPADDGVVVDNNQDGVVDGIWMDVGSPIRTEPDGRCFKPLVSYLVLDMDSRINVNAHGSLLADNPQMSEINLLGNPDPDLLRRGQGYGPAEIKMDPVLGTAVNSIMTGNGAYPGRYGFDGLPGAAGIRDVWSAYSLFGYPMAPFGNFVPGTVGGHFGSAMDLHGRFAMGYPQIFDVQDNQFPIGMPMANVGFSNLADEITDAPYELNFSDDSFFGPVDRQADRLFTPRELEAVLRRYDTDSRLLPQRLVELGGGVFSGAANQLVTTASFEVPTLSENLSGRLFRILSTSNSGSGEVGIPDSTANRDVVIRNTLRRLLPPEIMRGLPMNVNRPFGDGVDNNGDGVIDEIGESDTLDHPAGGAPLAFDHDNDSSTVGDSDTIFARSQFARHLYIVMLLATERVDRNGDGNVTAADWYDFNDDGTTDDDDRIAYRLAIAQWAINVVDFRDPDSIMTPFEVDLNPWDGWDVDDNLTTTEPTDQRRLLWGAERPELLLTETLATHDRRTQDLSIESVPAGETAGQVSAGDDSDFDSHLVPRSSVFFELYNPWVINDANQIRPTELYDSGLNGVDLQKKSLDGSTPVWRLVVTDTGENDYDPDQPENNPGQAAPRLVRRIYFTRPLFGIDVGPEVFFPEDSISVEGVAPGQYAVVGSAGVQVGDRYDTYFGRRSTPNALDNPELQDQTRRISLNPTAGEIEIVSAIRNGVDVEMQVSTREIVNIPIGLNDGGWPREMGVSDPDEGYYFATDPVRGFPINLTPVPDGSKFTEDTSTGVPVDYAFDEPIDRLLNRTHYDTWLQDDGLRAGYRVVHLQRLANPLRPYNATSNPYRTIDSSALDLFVFNGVESQDDPLGAAQVMRFGTSERRKTDNDDPDQVSDGRHRLLFRHDRAGQVSAMENPANDFTGDDMHVFGWNLEESLGRLNQAYRDAGSADSQPFASLTWNNRPFVSQLELANTPFTSSAWLTRQFNSGDRTRDVYQPPKATDPESGPNLAGQFAHLLNFYSDEIESETNGPSLHRAMSFLEVPSRFLGTEVFVNPLTFEDNAQGLSFGLAAPFDRLSNYRYPGKININTVLDPRIWDGLMGGFAADLRYADWERSRQGSSSWTQFANPLRPAVSSNLVPAADMVVDPVDCSLFRQGLTSGDPPLFDFQPGTSIPARHDDRAAYFKYEMRQRLGNLATGRSSVFAVWITVGLFEVNPDGSLKKDAAQRGIELGSDTGEIHRGRGFFMVDRSIPVAFEPGINHNVDRAVLVKSIVE